LTKRKNEKMERMQMGSWRTSFTFDREKIKNGEALKTILQKLCNRFNIPYQSNAQALTDLLVTLQQQEPEKPAISTEIKQPIIEYDEFGFVKNMLCPHCNSPNLKKAHVDDVGQQWFKCENCGQYSTKPKPKISTSEQPPSEIRVLPPPPCPYVSEGFIDPKLGIQMVFCDNPARTLRRTGKKEPIAVSLSACKKCWERREHVQKQKAQAEQGKNSEYAKLLECEDIKNKRWYCALKQTHYSFETVVDLSFLDCMENYPRFNCPNKNCERNLAKLIGYAKEENGEWE
jgi:hypothetical protein